MALVRFGWILLLMTPSDVELSVCIGIFGCLCPNSLRIICMYTASLEAIYREPSSASAADVMTFFMICLMVSMAPLFGENVVLLDKKKFPPDHLLASDLLRYPALLCVASFIWLHEYVSTASSCVAT